MSASATSVPPVSDRTACYLASARPALVQATGLEDRIPTGEGLLTFSTLDEAVEGVERILADYEAHATAARQVAEYCFASEVVLSEMVEVARQDSGHSDRLVSGTFRSLE